MRLRDSLHDLLKPFKPLSDVFFHKMYATPELRAGTAKSESQSTAFASASAQSH
jgi:hypothetical protein